MPFVIKIAVVEHVQMCSNSRPEELSTQRKDLLHIPGDALPLLPAREWPPHRSSSVSSLSVRVGGGAYF